MICIGSLEMNLQNKGMETRNNFKVLQHSISMLVFIMGVVICAPRVVMADDNQEITNNVEGVVPLRSLLAQVHKAYPGRVLEVELEQEESVNGCAWVYEVKLLTEEGNVLKLDYDAMNLELLKIKGRLEK